MKKFILTIVFFVIGVFRPRKRELTKPKDYYLKKQLQNPAARKPKIKKYKNSK